MSGTDVCPCCPKVATSHGSHLRSDNLRFHVKNKHSEKFDATYIDAGGWTIKVLSPKRIVKVKAGKLGFGYCFQCFHWISTVGYNQTNIERHILDHECIQKQVREKKLRVVGGKIIPRDKKMETAPFIQAAKRHGLDDYVELNDDCEVDLDKTFAKLKGRAPAADPTSIWERLKKSKRLVGLKLQDLEEARRDNIDEGNIDLDEEDVPEVFDELDVLEPILVEYGKTIPQREAQSKIIRDQKMELEMWDDKHEMMIRQKDAEIATLKQRLMDLSISTSEARCRSEAEILRLKALVPQEQQEPAVPADDTIQHVGGNNFQQWSLPFQG